MTTVKPSVDQIIIAALSKRYAELVSMLLRGEQPTRGELLKHAAMIGKLYQTSEIAVVMTKGKKA